MRRRAAIVLLLVLAWCGPGFAEPSQPGVPQILVHYMPWFESKELSGKWGWHWTMNHFNPDEVDAQGERKIASHYHPLIGPYDSADLDVLEYHTLLMKIAGIEGVIADWYGNEDVNDYGMIHRRTSLLFELCRRRGLNVCICYEERILKAMIEKNLVAPDQIAARAKMHVRYCEEHWFENPLYSKWREKPVLLSYGPESLKPAQWQEILSGFQPRPALFLLHELHPPADGSFAWPPMWRSKNGVLDPRELDQYLAQFYKQTNVKIGGAFPGFHDIYRQAGVGPSYGFLDARQGRTFQDTLKQGLAADCPFVQIITWNDFGEGTCIEPTREYEYRYLEDLQKLREQRTGKAAKYRPADLRLPLRIYRLRKGPFKALATATPTLDRAVDLLFAGDTGQAVRLVDDLERQRQAPPER